MISVLYVDDEPVLLEIGKEFLERSGDFSVMTVDSAVAALQMLKDKQFDVIISDYLMPEMNGLTFLEEVRHSYGKIPFILFTGKGHEEIVIKALNLGADFYLQKGEYVKTQYTDLADMVRQAVHRRETEQAVVISDQDLLSKYEALQENLKTVQLSEHTYRSIIENLQDAFYRTDMDGILTMVNPSFVEMFRYQNPEEIVGKKFSESLYNTPDDRKKFLEELQSAGKVREHHISLKRADGTPIEVSASSHYYFDESGVPAGIEGIIHDITDLIQVQKARTESEKRYHLLADNVQDVIWTADIDMNLTYISPSVKVLRGYTPKEAMALSLKDSLTPESFETIMRKRQEGMEAMMSGIPVSKNQEMELEFYCKDGSTVWTEVIITPAFDPQGRMDGVVGVTRDITARKLAEAAIRTSERNLRTVMDHLPDLVLVHREGIVRYVNPAMRDSMGFQTEEVVNHPILSFIAPEYHARVQEMVHKRLKTGRDEPYEIELISHSGERRIALVRGSVIEFDGSPACLNVITDITRQKMTERALQESEEKFRSFVENANDIVFSMALDGTITYVSPKWTELLGYSYDETIGTTAERYIHPDDLPRLREFFTKTITTGQRQSGIEYRALHKNGSLQWQSQSISPIRTSDGTITGAQGICHDITERKKIEDSLRQANRQLNLLTSITRHDILNKVSVLLIYLEGLEAVCTDPHLCIQLQKMVTATREIQSQIEFTRVYEDLGAHEPLWQNLDDLMPIKQVPAEITLKAETIGYEIFADPMLKKVFFNLLDNTVRHGHRVTEISVSAEESNGVLRIIWEDNGIGIPLEEKERIFERGFGKNTGLGMFLAREILLLTGITIKETGIPDNGARFEILVPKGAYRRV